MSEHQKHHEIIRPLIEIAQQVGSYVMDKIVPDEAVVWGGGPMLDRELNPGQVGAVPARPTLLED